MRHNRPLLLSTALLFACGYASAAESQHLSADGNAACPDTTANSSASNDRNELGDIDPITNSVAPIRRAEKAKVMVAPRGGTRVTAPRWHSFLPGMFR